MLEHNINTGFPNNSGSAAMEGASGLLPLDAADVGGKSGYDVVKDINDKLKVFNDKSGDWKIGIENVNNLEQIVGWWNDTGSGELKQVKVSEGDIKGWEGDILLFKDFIGVSEKITQEYDSWKKAHPTDTYHPTERQLNDLHSLESFADLITKDWKRLEELKTKDVDAKTKEDVASTGTTDAWSTLLVLSEDAKNPNVEISAKETKWLDGLTDNDVNYIRQKIELSEDSDGKIPQATIDTMNFLSTIVKSNSSNSKLDWQWLDLGLSYGTTDAWNTLLSFEKMTQTQDVKAKETKWLDGLTESDVNYIRQKIELSEDSDGFYRIPQATTRTMKFLDGIVKSNSSNSKLDWEWLDFGLSHGTTKDAWSVFKSFEGQKQTEDQLNKEFDYYMDGGDVHSVIIKMEEEWLSSGKKKTDVLEGEVRFLELLSDYSMDKGTSVDGRTEDIFHGDLTDVNSDGSLKMEYAWNKRGIGKIYRIFGYGVYGSEPDYGSDFDREHGVTSGGDSE